MKPEETNQPWARLVAAARRTPASDDTAAPYGFATRVAARAFAAERPMRSLFERFSLRAVGVAGLLAVVSVAANYSALGNLAAEEESVSSSEDAVAVLLGPVE